VHKQQSSILDDLCAIEAELDRNYAGQPMPSSDHSSKYLTKVFGQPNLDKQESREQVFTQALQLESEIEALQTDVGKCWQQFEMGERGAKSAADRYNLAGDPRKEQ